jgi:RNA polymerase sigma-70 factor (ECF subfamily)
MTDADTFALLMSRLRSGEGAAARDVFDRFAGRLVAPARTRFNRLLARKVDPKDVVPSAFKVGRVGCNPTGPSPCGRPDLRTR